MTIKWLRWADDKLTEGKVIEKMNSSSTYNKIYCLSFLLKDEIVGKTLLSLLPDGEKRDVFQQICLKLPVSNIGIDFFSNGKFLDFKKQVTLRRVVKIKTLGANIAADYVLV